MTYNKLSLGIDVGGTNTDGVLYDTETKEIAKWVKIPTNHGDYRQCITAAARSLLEDENRDNIISFNISTTLSTNALLEGHGAPVALILVGYDDFPNIKDEILDAVSPAALLCCSGGHNAWGFEREILDRAAIRRFAHENCGAYFAVSSLYSPRNPEHETEIAYILREFDPAGVTMSHEMARSKLNAVKRTVTAFLNSSLIKVTKELIFGVEFTAASFGLRAPVMFVRSDSSIVSSSWCARYPIETIFSGPAASMRGAAILGAVGSGDAAVADMGGTSTDIGIIINGRAVFSKEGATIGNYRTMIPSLEIHSIALGGDSRIGISDGNITIGPERIIPAALGGKEGITPTDALNTLGRAAVGDVARSEAACEEIGTMHNSGAKSLAQKICAGVTETLTKELSGYTQRKICVGAPVAPFAGRDCTVPPHADVASAAGAAASTLSLSCSVSIIHRFYDESYFAFLPERQARSENISELIKQAKDELEKYLIKQAERMGYSDVATHIEEEREYIGKIKNDATLSSVTLEGHAVCAKRTK